MWLSYCRWDAARRETKSLLFKLLKEEGISSLSYLLHPANWFLDIVESHFEPGGQGKYPRIGEPQDGRSLDTWKPHAAELPCRRAACTAYLQTVMWEIHFYLFKPLSAWVSVTNSQNNIPNRRVLWVSLFAILFLKFILFIYLAALGLRCCARAFSSCGERWLLFVAVHGLLVVVASLVEHGQIGRASCRERV